MSKRLYWIALLLCAFAAPHAVAQQVFGSIFGTVTDPSGSAVPNAKVVITDQEKGTRFETASNTDGNYAKDRLIKVLQQMERALEVLGKVAKRMGIL